MRHLLGLPLWLACTLPAAAQGLGTEAKAILHAHCAKCHDGGKAVKGGFGFVLDRDRLVSRLLVTPGKAGHSDLYLRMAQGEMPPASVKNRPSAAELKIIERWIDAGAPPFEPMKRVKTLTPAEVNDAILTDLEKLDARRHRFTRYLTLNHFALAGRATKDLETLREAVGKLLNSLSWHPRLSVPEAVDADGTILRIDLRAYKWSASQWDKLAFAYPYRLQTEHETKAFAKLTGAEAPVLRADWFVANASRPPLYHDLLQLPTSDRALERMLQVEVAANLQDDNVMRAGFNDSGVSKNNRLIERHDSAYGTFWRSYDFANNSGRQNLFEHPLGPNTGATSFQPAGGEMIFDLPNGLRAYMLVDAKGQRIDKGPTEIVADPRRPDQRVETGISCMSCHARGLLFKADQLRGHVEKNAPAFGKQVVETVRATHPRKTRFQTQIDDDNVRYLKALEKFGVRDAEQEPVNLVTLRFEGTLDGKTAAAELGLNIEDFAALLKQNSDHARIFGSLLVQGGTAQRALFQEQFPELARRILAMRAANAAKIATKREPSFTGHTATVNAIAFAPNGMLAGTGSDDRTIQLWQVPTGQRIAVLTAANGGEVYAVAFSSDGKFLASAGRDRVIRLWSVETHELVRTFRGATDSLRAVAFSPDGKRLAAAGDDRSVRVWDIASGDEVGSLDGHTAPVTAIVWARDGQRFYSSSRDGSVRGWDVAKQRQLILLEGHAGPILCLTLASDGKTILTGGNDQTVRQWTLADAKETACFKGHPSGVIHVHASSGGKFDSVASQHRSREPIWRRFNLANRNELGSRKAAADESFNSAAVSPDGRFLLVGGPGGFLRLLSW
jgi:WD40 repeat protein/mono/diheme cytochrome c family protein